MTENDTLFYQAWVSDLQISVDAMREQREEERKTIAELMRQIQIHKQTIERLQVAMSQGDDFR